MKHFGPLLLSTVLIVPAARSEPRHELAIAGSLGAGMSGAYTGSDGAGPVLAGFAAVRAEYGIVIDAGFRAGLELIAARSLVGCHYYGGCAGPDGFGFVAPAGFVAGRWGSGTLQAGPRFGVGYGVGRSYAPTFDLKAPALFLELGAELAWIGRVAPLLRASLFISNLQSEQLREGSGIGGVLLTVGGRYSL